MVIFSSGSHILRLSASSCAAPIGVFFKCKTLFKALAEHFIPRLQVVDEEETVGFPRRLLIQPVQLLLWQQALSSSITASSSCWSGGLHTPTSCPKKELEQGSLDAGKPAHTYLFFGPRCACQASSASSRAWKPLRTPQSTLVRCE